jgi:hypothetical protein
VARPYQGVGTACRQGENQQDLLVGIQEACPEEELAYLSEKLEGSNLNQVPGTCTYQVGSWAYPAEARNPAAYLVEEAACLRSISVRFPNHISFQGTYQQGSQAACHPEASGNQAEGQQVASCLRAVQSQAARCSA